MGRQHNGFFLFQKNSALHSPRAVSARQIGRWTKCCNRENSHIHIDNLPGAACRVWMDVLLAAGNEVEYVDLGTGTDGVLPAAGRNIPWMLAP